MLQATSKCNCGPSPSCANSGEQRPPLHHALPSKRCPLSKLLQSGGSREHSPSHPDDISWAIIMGVMQLAWVTSVSLAQHMGPRLARWAFPRTWKSLLIPTLLISVRATRNRSPGHAAVSDTLSVAKPTMDNGTMLIDFAPLNDLNLTWA